MHLFRLMTSRAVVCDVWYLEPQYLRPGETPIEFAGRARDMIAARAGLIKGQRHDCSSSGAHKGYRKEIIFFLKMMPSESLGFLLRAICTLLQ
ncbi:glycerol-3-phosphate O-acyltransferase 3/4 [Apostasia shenzhenica]|uniref:Glycerol-3-phosphate O-acyltransferase 3/4 n=1 Tax=Apostasia shenzhenica TaxID=1088818 RepID=A0A2H9ZQU1_9ASPA|nr:glycerol-3-phosphate O-acyltransferase 3/4 [Apostasia shenzhenica]